MVLYRNNEILQFIGNYFIPYKDSFDGVALDCILFSFEMDGNSFKEIECRDCRIHNECKTIDGEDCLFGNKERYIAKIYRP